MDNLNAEICFALRLHNEDVVNLIGIGININIDIHSMIVVTILIYAVYGVTRFLCINLRRSFP